MGRVLLAWTRSLRSSFGAQINAEALSVGGGAIGHSAQLNRTRGVPQLVTVTPDGQLGFRVVWTSAASPLSGQDGAFERDVNGRGLPRGPMRRLPAAGPPGPEGYAFDAVGRAGGFVVVYPTTPTSTVLDASRISPEGRRVGRPVRLVDVGGQQLALSPVSVICSRVRRRCLVAWSRIFAPYSFPTTPGPPPEVQAVEVDVSKRALAKGPPVLLSDPSADPADGASNAALVPLGSRRILIAWVGGAAAHPPSASADYEIFIRVVNVHW